MCPEGADIEDLAAEALARALLRWGALEGAEYRSAWVMRVASNLARDEWRALKRRRRVAVAGWAVTDERVDEIVTSRVILAAALTRLSRRQRQAVVLHFAADLSIADTAKAMGVTNGTARTHLDRGVNELRRILGPNVVEVLSDEG
jgi:RNA polymerase sigma-70 factor (ECF subfamily)